MQLYDNSNCIKGFFNLITPIYPLFILSAKKTYFFIEKNRKSTSPMKMGIF